MPLLFLLAAILVAGAVQAQEQSPSQPGRSEPVTDPCDAPRSDGTDAAAEAEGASLADCEQTTESFLLPQENRDELSDEISENTQDALTLQRLLLGRSYTFFGRIEPDYASYFNGVLKDEDGLELRRLRAGFVGVLSDTLSYRGELDLTDGTNNFSDFYLKWDTPGHGSFTIGNQRVAQNLSAMTGVVSLLFMERPLPVTTFSLARRLAVSQDFYLNKFGIHAVLFTRDPNNDAGKYGAALRVITNPVRTDGGLAHLGFSLVREKMDRDARYRTRPESHVTDIRLVDTGNYDDVEYQNILGVEVAGARGASTLRAEAFISRWERTDSRENDFVGAYIEIGRFLTGQGFRYRDGKFVRPRIEQGTRAWEVALRASWVDLNDGDVRGGEQKNLGVALNWYPRGNLRALFNLIYYDAERDAGDEDGLIAQARVQLTW